MATSFWTDDVLRDIASNQPQLINDSKTPSGRVHVGALRGVLIHDALFRSLQQRGIPARYIYGVDDYDPLDELPIEHRSFYRPYLGTPLCNTPSPPGSDSSDLADYYMSEFFQVFDELEVGASSYRMRDVYRSGEFDQAIDAILRSADTVRDIYTRISGSQRSRDWLPFQVICPSCGKIGTTYCRDYDGETVTYECRPDLVKWARGCGATGRLSPFSGNGKLVWKLEWTAKWAVFGITIEGAGKDHSGKGGSRDVSSACLRDIFHKQAPINVPYEFILAKGAKMSSSRGVGVSAREMADLLPPSLLRYLIIRTNPRSAVNFEPSNDAITHLFAEFDRARREAASQSGGRMARAYWLSTSDDPNYWAPQFPLTLALEQLPHVSLGEQLERLKGEPLTNFETLHARERQRVARQWLDRFALPEEKLSLLGTLPVGIHLTSQQRNFLTALTTELSSLSWTPDDLQDAIFRIARDVDIPETTAFSTIYELFFGRNHGPRAGSVLSFLDRGFVIGRLHDAANLHYVV